MLRPSNTRPNTNRPSKTVIFESNGALRPRLWVMTILAIIWTRSDIRVKTTWPSVRVIRSYRIVSNRFSTLSYRPVTPTLTSPRFPTPTSSLEPSSGASPPSSPAMTSNSTSFISETCRRRIKCTYSSLSMCFYEFVRARWGRRILNALCLSVWCSEVGKHIEESLKWMKCPYTLEASQIQNLDSESIIPAIQWLLDRLRSSQKNAKYEVSESSTQLVLFYTYMHINKYI